MTLQKILKEQKRDLETLVKVYTRLHNGDSEEFAKGYIEGLKEAKHFIDKSNAKIIEACAGEMTGEKQKEYPDQADDMMFFNDGYDKRVKEEQEKAEELLNETK